jgi:CysZ protein
MPPMPAPILPFAPDPLGPLNAPRPGFVAGAGAMLEGLTIIAKAPALWPLALVPAAIGSALTAGFSLAAVHWVPGLVKHWIHDDLASVFATILALVISIALAILVGFGLAQPLSGFALEKIVHHVEASELLPSAPKAGFLVNLQRSLLTVVVSWAFALPLLALLLVVNVVVPVAVVVTVPLKLAVIALLVAWDLCDYPLSLRGIPMRERVAFMARNARAMMGFGLGLALLSLLPCVLLFAIPAGVAGATRLIGAIERAEGRRLVGKSEEV